MQNFTKPYYERILRMFISCIIGLSSFAIMILFVIFSQNCLVETQNALNMFLSSVFPTMFPFYVLTSVFLSSALLPKISKVFTPIARLYKLPSEVVSAILLGMLCGFPVGAKVTCDLYQNNLITKKQASLLASFTNNAGPVYVITVIGGIHLNNKFLGFIIWLCLIFSSLLSGLILCKLTLEPKPAKKQKNTRTENKIDIASSVMSGLNTAMYVGAVIIFFASITSLLKKIPFLSGTLYTIIYSITELTGGLNALSKLLLNPCAKTPSMLNLAIISAVASWSGFCVHIQVCGILKSCNLKLKYYFFVKLLQPLMAFIFMLLISNFFKIVSFS